MMSTFRIFVATVLLGSLFGCAKIKPSSSGLKFGCQDGPNSERCDDADLRKVEAELTNLWNKSGPITINHRYMCKEVERGGGPPYPVFFDEVYSLTILKVNIAGPSVVVTFTGSAKLGSQLGVPQGLVTMHFPESPVIGGNGWHELKDPENIQINIWKGDERVTNSPYCRPLANPSNGWGTNPGILTQEIAVRFKRLFTEAIAASGF